MINIETISSKLKRLFNGTDTQNANEISLADNNFYFEVKTEGFELKEIYDLKSGKNFIPVFIAQEGGEFNPVPNVGEYSINTRVAIYFPVRLKDIFYQGVTSFLQDTFVGKVIDFDGEYALCNVSMPMVGEIENFSVKEFQNFVQSNYKVPITISEAWMALEFSLYLTTSSKYNDLFLANDVSVILSYKGKSIPVSFEEITFAINSSPNAEQLLNTKITKMVVTTTADSYSISFYAKNSEGIKALIEDALDGEIQNQQVSVIILMKNIFKNYKGYIDSLTMPIRLGEFVKIGLSISRRID